MREFWGALRAEIIKLKYSGVLWLCTVGTVFTNLMIAIIPWQFPIVSEYLAIDPLASWKGWMQWHYLGILPMLLPMFLVIICALALLTENRNRSWKLLYALPVPKGGIYLSKLTVISLMFAGSHLLFLILMVLIPFVPGYYADLGNLPVGLMFRLGFGTILSCLGILSLVYLVSYFSRSFVLPLAVGILGFVLAQLIRDYHLGGWWFPFSWPVEVVDAIFKDGSIEGAILISVAFFMAFTALGMVLAGRDQTKSF